MLNKISKACMVLAAAALPFVTFAQLTQTRTLLGNAKSIVTGILIPLIFTLALLFFFYGVAKYIWSVGQGKEEGKKIMIWGVIALFVMSSVWGIIYFLRTEFDINDDTEMPIPTIEES